MAWRHGSSFRAGGAGIFNPAVRMFGEPPRLPGMCRATRRPLPAAKARELDTIGLLQFIPAVHYERSVLGHVFADRTAL